MTFFRNCIVVEQEASFQKTDDVLEEASEDGAGLLVDVAGDSLDSTSSCESADSWFGDSEDGVAESLSGLESLGSGFASSGLSFSSSSNLCSWCHLYDSLFLSYYNFSRRSLNTALLELKYAHSVISLANG